jgi:hypothetical protein
VQRPQRLLMVRAKQGGEAVGDQRQLVDRRACALLDVACEPPHGVTTVAVWLLPRDQRRQLQRVAEGEPPHLPRRRLGNDQVPTLYRSQLAIAVANEPTTAPGDPWLE